MIEFETHTETIICPECQSEQQATVEHRFPWWSYVHLCTCCGIYIMESEWNNKPANNESIAP